MLGLVDRLDDSVASVAILVENCTVVFVVSGNFVVTKNALRYIILRNRQMVTAYRRKTE